MKKAALHNLGCKVNAYEAEAMQQSLTAAGYEIVPFAPGADVYIINTCTVTNIADRKSRQMLHKAKKMNPAAIVVAAGCYVQTEAAKGEIDPAIDLVLGNNHKNDIVNILKNYEEGQLRENSASDMSREREYEKMQLRETGEHTRAYIKVQDGCNQFCSYCIIPYVRGRVRSRQLTDVLDEIDGLTARGYQEFVLTGIHLSSYGTDLDDNKSLLTLINAVHELKGVKRIRLGSLEQGIITEEFVSAIHSLPKMCPHFHLSLQSGCNETLKRMNRRYTAEDFADKCSILRKYYEQPALTTDVIVGFPGETKEEYMQSYNFVDGIDFYETHIFKYSRREGTKAAAMKEQLPEKTKAERSRKMIDLGAEKKAAYMKRFIGREVEILLEEPAEENGETYWCGYTKEYLKTAVKAEGNMENRLVTARAVSFLNSDILLCEITG